MNFRPKRSSLFYRSLPYIFGALAVFSFAIFFAPTHASAATYYVAANGNDSNNGTSTSTPWVHAPGMPNCTGTCATVSPAPGDRFIFRGGDTWHFGNSALTPYAGGTWDLHTLSFSAGNDPACVYEGTMTGCIYLGVNQTWYSGGSWTRPILTGDNPTSTSTVATCAYQVPNTAPDVKNTIVSLARDFILDNFEITGLCSKNVNSTSGSMDTYVAYLGTGISGYGTIFEENLYIHGWTATSGAGGGDNTVPITLIGGGAGGLQAIDHLVIDGKDSEPGLAGWGTFPSFYHFKDSIVRYATQGVGQYCHDIHDVIWEHMYNPTWPTHGNVFECNDDSPGNAVNQPQNTPNVFYNNIVRDDDPGLSGGNPRLWFCPETVPEYWFDNLIYDEVPGAQMWDIAGPPGYSCSNSGGQFMFNNTLVDGQQPWVLGGSNTTGGKYLTVYNEHLINSPYDGSGGLGVGGPNSTSNISMSDATAITQGYLLSSGGTAETDTCANSNSTPCAPVSASNATVGVGLNLMSYCNTLASYTSEPAISTDAANACKYGATDACTYNQTSHSMVCPGEIAVARPTTGAWDVGAYEYAAAISVSFNAMITGILKIIGRMLFR